MRIGAVSNLGNRCLPAGQNREKVHRTTLARHFNDLNLSLVTIKIHVKQLRLWGKCQKDIYAVNLHIYMSTTLTVPNSSSFR